MKRTNHRDYIGQKFGMLTALEYVGAEVKSKSSLWRVRCDCGTEKVMRFSRVIAGGTISCGCYGQARSWKITHGMSRTRMYRIYRGMKTRTESKTNKDWARYGGKGIRCEWPSFEDFRDWSVANGYAEDMTIDRINPDRNYCPDNCRWTDAKTQNSNKRCGKCRAIPWANIQASLHDLKLSHIAGG